jgi:hypothetical protein
MIRALALTLLVVASASAARAGEHATLELGVNELRTLEYVKSISRVAVSDPNVLLVHAGERKLDLTGQSGGKTTLVVWFDSGESVGYDVRVAGPARVAEPEPVGTRVDVGVGQQVTVPAAGASRIMLSDDGIAKVKANGETLTISGVKAGAATLIVTDGAGGKTTYSIRVK